jgi:hypothetical protein
VTYGGHPLYFYAHEAKNEVKCHNIRGFGGLWLVVTLKGEQPHPDLVTIAGVQVRSSEGRPGLGAGRDKNTSTSASVPWITCGVGVPGGSSRSTSARRCLPGTQVG